MFFSLAPLILLAPTLGAPTQEYRWFKRGWYVGASLGESQGDVSESSLDDALADQGFITSSSLEDGDTAWKLFGGYRFELPVAIELSYVDLGQLRAEVDLSVVDIDTFLDTLVDTQPFFGEGFALAANYYPIEAKRVAIGLRGGLWVWQAEIEARAATGERAKRSESGIDPLLGAHLLFDVTDRFQLRAEYERYFVEGEGIDLLSIGVQVRLL